MTTVTTGPSVSICPNCTGHCCPRLASQKSRGRTMGLSKTVPPLMRPELATPEHFRGLIEERLLLCGDASDAEGVMHRIPAHAEFEMHTIPGGDGAGGPAYVAIYSGAQPPMELLADAPLA